MVLQICATRVRVAIEARAGSARADAWMMTGHGRAGGDVAPADSAAPFRAARKRSAAIGGAGSRKRRLPVVADVPGGLKRDEIRGGQGGDNERHPRPAWRAPPADAGQ